MKISDFAAHSGLTPDTVRYYERIGLLPRSTRDAGGRRTYGMADLGWASFLRKLQAMGMPMRERLEYSRLRSVGASTTRVRRGMLEAHRAALAARQAELVDLIATLDDKIAHYHALETEIAAQDGDARRARDDAYGATGAGAGPAAGRGGDHAG